MIVGSKGVRHQSQIFRDSFRQATKTDHGYLLLDLHPLTPDPVRVRTSIFLSVEVEIFAPASETKEVRVDLHPSGYIKRLQNVSEVSDGKVKGGEKSVKVIA